MVSEEVLLEAWEKLKKEKPEEYEALVKAEQAMYESWLRHEGRIK